MKRKAIKPLPLTDYEIKAFAKEAANKTATKLDREELCELLSLRADLARIQADLARIQAHDQDFSESIISKYGNPGETISLGAAGEIVRAPVKEAA